MYMGSFVTTANNCTSLLCRSVFIKFASSRKAKGDMLPSFNIFMATLTLLL